jgi:hypothetical protein
LSWGTRVSMYANSHQAVVEKIKYYNSLDRGCLAILLDTKVSPGTTATAMYLPS